MKTLGFAISLLLLGCGIALGRPDIRFCDFGQKPDSRDVLILDLADHRLMGSDTVSTFDVIETNSAIGIVGQMPISLPKHRLMGAHIPAKWEMGGYRFSATTPNPLDPDWVLIYAVPVKPYGANIEGLSTTVLYSQSQGVIAIRRVYPVPDAKVMREEIFSCGKQHLLPSSFTDK